MGEIPGKAEEKRSVRLTPAKGGFGGRSSSLPLLWRAKCKEEPTLSTAGLTLVVLSQGSVALKERHGQWWNQRWQHKHLSGREA